MFALAVESTLEMYRSCEEVCSLFPEGSLLFLVLSPSFSIESEFDISQTFIFYNYGKHVVFEETYSICKFHLFKFSII